jgi:peptide methionine sulfoxide reductase MsrB
VSTVLNGGLVSMRSGIYQCNIVMCSSFVFSKLDKYCTACAGYCSFWLM